MKNIPQIKILVLLIGMMITSLSTTNAQNDQAYIYGEITMIDNQKFIGEIRWGDEEAFWDDIFNSSKKKNQFIKYLDRDEMDRDDDDDDDRDKKRWSFDFGDIWVDGGRWGFSNSHTFACRFGDISKMTVIGRNEVELEFKDGTTMELDGGSNDLGNSIKVYDQEIGEMKLRWDRIEEIKFMSTPKNLEDKFGSPLFGKVETSQGEFEGYILWDNDECLGSDKLDGDSDNGDVSIAFDKIAEIEAERRGASVTLKSGRKMYLTGSNDVNDENRGIVVKTNEFGRVLINWREFDKITFTEPKNAGPSYDDYKNSKKLNGTVITMDGEEYSGILAYDLDEEWAWEMLDGKDDGFEYTIPFEKIKSIKPKNYNYTSVELKSGKTLLLGDTQDVTERNDGILIFKGQRDNDPTYVRWKDVEKVVFD